MTASVEASIDPSSRLTFLLDWELTLKCNYDCTYCKTGLYGGHDNTTKHPPLNECLSTIDFMFEYVNLHMQHKKSAFKHVVLNVYGGEALFHPDIDTILTNVKDKYQQFKDSWSLSISVTTNLSLTTKKLKVLSPLIDNWTCSYHAESTDKQKKQFKNNLLLLKSQSKKIKVVNLIHPNEQLFLDTIDLTEWCKTNNISCYNRQLDQYQEEEFYYNEQQVSWFNSYHQSRTNKKTIYIQPTQEKSNLADIGRSCCGGRMLCADGDFKNKLSFISNKFKGWTCSVNHFFIFIKQVNGEIFNNKDCKINYSGQLGPIGNLKDPESLLKITKEFLNKGENAGITCIKNKCNCGLCAPKSADVSSYSEIMKKYFQ